MMQNDIRNVQNILWDLDSAAFIKKMYAHFFSLRLTAFIRASVLLCHSAWSSSLSVCMFCTIFQIRMSVFCKNYKLCAEIGN